jgi:hypothetical protein
MELVIVNMMDTYIYTYSIVNYSTLILSHSCTARFRLLNPELLSAILYLFHVEIVLA